MTKITMERTAIFLEQLTRLSIDTDVYIGGCGCCGAPSLVYDPELISGGHYVSGDGAHVEWRVGRSAQPEEQP